MPPPSPSSGFVNLPQLPLTIHRSGEDQEDSPASQNAAASTCSARALSFAEVYSQHYGFVWRVLRAFGLPPAVAEDAAQDVFVVVHRRLPEFDGRHDIRSWLFRIVSFVVTTERRRFRKAALHEPIDDAERPELPDRGPGPFESASNGETLRAVKRALSRMDEAKRIVFVLMDIEEMKAQEVAELLSANVRTVYSRLRLAREQFRSLLEMDEARDSAGKKR